MEKKEGGCLGECFEEEMSPALAFAPVFFLCAPLRLETVDLDLLLVDAALSGEQGQDLDTLIALELDN